VQLLTDILVLVQITVNEDLGFLRDQIITSEVNIARVFNYDVRVRRAAKEAAVMEKIEGESA
jgi:hypothetical protein